MLANTEINCKSFDVIKKVQEDVTTVRWTVYNFTKSYLLGDQLESDKFYIDTNMFTLVLNCPGFNDNDDFSFFLYQYFEERDLVDIEAKAWLEDVDGNKYYESEIDDSNRSRNIDVAYYFKKSLQKQDLGTKIKLKNGTVVFCAEIKKHVPGEKIVLPKVDLELRQKLWDSYQNGLIDSITIQVEDKEFKVSKTILAANSNVFQQMLLTSNCKEVQNGIIEIKETSYEIMKAFIEYMHKGEVSNLPDVCGPLFVLAHKYLVVSLQEDCSKEMVKSLNKENIFDRLKFAFLYDEEDLKEATLEYVTSKESDMNFLQIMKSPQWISFLSENVLVAQEITTAVFEKIQWFSEQSNGQVQTGAESLIERPL